MLRDVTMFTVNSVAKGRFRGRGEYPVINIAFVLYGKE